MKLGEYVSKFSYPGRGVALGRSADGKKALMVYFIMGRSENSRNRMFVQEERAVRTKAVDESRMTDPSLIIYSPVRVLGKSTRPTPSVSTLRTAAASATRCSPAAMSRTRRTIPPASAARSVRPTIKCLT